MKRYINGDNINYKIKKGELFMKKTSAIIANFAKKSAEKALRRDANVTTCGAVFQPKAPKDLKKFSKFDK